MSLPMHPRPGAEQAMRAQERIEALARLAMLRHATEADLSWLLRVAKAAVEQADASHAYDAAISARPNVTPSDLQQAELHYERSKDATVAAVDDAPSHKGVR